MGTAAAIQGMAMPEDGKTKREALDKSRGPETDAGVNLQTEDHYARFG